MNATSALRAAQRTPLIKFIGKRSPPSSVDHTPSPHPASPGALPDSFVSYRAKAQQHGPLNASPPTSPRSSQNIYQSLSYGAIGGHSGHSLGPVAAPEGIYFDRSELPERFRKVSWTQAEIEAIETGGASLVG
ncbi:MAG: hypothetical protein MMC33_007527 [Icmadophila ericetorum]|nr:hypothetical protein [Icmadophila ericetorum]